MIYYHLLQQSGCGIYHRLKIVSRLLGEQLTGILIPLNEQTALLISVNIINTDDVILETWKQEADETLCHIYFCVNSL